MPDDAVLHICVCSLGRRATARNCLEPAGTVRLPDGHFREYLTMMQCFDHPETRLSPARNGNEYRSIRHIA
jgi:hypothetical protein